MSNNSNSIQENIIPKQSKWRNLIKQEDWWTVWVGLFLVVLPIILWGAGTSIKVFIPQIQTWSDLQTLGSRLSQSLTSLILLFVLLLVLFSIVVSFLKVRVSHFISGFILLFILSFIINIFSA